MFMREVRAFAESYEQAQHREEERGVKANAPRHFPLRREDNKVER
jgi:hypothetical protein